MCCDELNTLVPFCDSETDKVTTLQWTTAFLRYITKTYGDTFKEVGVCRKVIDEKCPLTELSETRKLWLEDKS